MGMKKISLFFSFLLVGGLLFFNARCQEKKSSSFSKNKPSKKEIKQGNMEIATLGAGCFWCVESVFLDLKGVTKVESGYSGGPKPNPTYKEVCSGTTGHAEVVQVTFDPAALSFEEVLEVFFQTHDPTTLNRQGNDVGTQYRSAIFYHSDNQKEKALSIIKALNESKAWDKPIVTEVSAATAFFPAEDYHQNYYNLNKEQPYCQYVIRPKLEKFRKVFKEKLK
jgi:peptide-methionine (S)-S-oxide reductase